MAHYGLIAGEEAKFVLGLTTADFGLPNALAVALAVAQQAEAA